MKYILTLEAYYKKRGLIGKAVDLIKGRKDFNDLLEGDKALGIFGKVYSINKDDPSKLSLVNDDVDGQSKVINWVKNNPNSILILGLNRYKNAAYNRHQLIKFDILVKDILEVVDRRLEVLSIEINSKYEYDWIDFFVEVLLKEDDWQEGDGMPDDIYEDYVQMVKTGLKKKKEQYVKHRSTRLYSVTTEYRSKLDDERGLLKVVIDPRM